MTRSWLLGARARLGRRPGAGRAPTARPDDGAADAGSTASSTRPSGDTPPWLAGRDEPGDRRGAGRAGRPGARGRARAALAPAARPRARGCGRHRRHDPSPRPAAAAGAARAPRPGLRRRRRAGGPGPVRAVSDGPPQVVGSGRGAAPSPGSRPTWSPTRCADAGQPSRIVIVETDGDRRAPDTAWGEGAFVAAIERALLDGRVDVAVHSAKDVPTDVDGRACGSAPTCRGPTRATRSSCAPGHRARGWTTCRPGPRVGTDSPRRTGFLRARRPDLDVHPLHGNVDTRLRRLDEGETDALSWPVPASTGWAWAIGSPSGSTRASCRPRPARARSRSRSGPTTTGSAELVAAIDDPRPASRSRPSARSSMRRAAAAGPRSVRSRRVVGDQLELLGGYAAVRTARAP